jgi:penicillin G amidase
VTANRVLTYINIAIAVALLTVLLAAFWFLWRPLPQTSGTISAPVEREITVSRDHLGVPHIYAATIEDALFAQGYATAQDRLWQMDATRRTAAGELSEVVGALGFESDQGSRRLRLRRIAEAQAKNLSVADRVLFAAYARGVNYYIEKHQNNFPLEFRLLGYEPRPWSIADCMLVALQMARTLTSTWERDVQKQSMLSAGNPAKVELLFSPRGGSYDLLPGSNAWVVSGAHTRSGKPILANDTHLEYRMPATWYMVHLKAQDLNAAGLSLPGLPGVIIGHNEQIAWGVTNLGFDVQDLYYEDLDTTTGQYTFRGQVRQAQLESELVPIKGQRHAEARQWITEHGPVSFTFENKYLALRWTAAEVPFEYPILEINRASNWQEFRTALARYPGPAQNFVYADRSGNIGYQVAGKLPVRSGFDGSVPVDGSSGKYEWGGYIPFDDLPTVYNPPSGVIVTANQNPFPANYRYTVSGNFEAGYRAARIREALARKKTFDEPSDMLAIQKDVYSGFSHFLAKEIVAAWDRKKAANAPARSVAAIAVLRTWNGQMETGLAAPLIVSLTRQHLQRSIAEHAAPGKSQDYRRYATRQAIEHLLRTRPAGWFPNWDQLLLDRFEDALAEGDRMQGGNPEKWNWGVYKQLRIVHPVAGRLPLIHGFFNVGPVPMSGSSDTIKQIGGNVGPSQRFVADLSAWDRSLLNITVGQSGHVLSANQKDQWRAYYYGESFPQQFATVRVREALIFRPERADAQGR